MGRPVTLEKAAHETGFTETALHRKIQRGELPYYLPFGGGKIVIDLEELQTLMLQNRQSVTWHDSGTLTQICIDFGAMFTNSIKLAKAD